LTFSALSREKILFNKIQCVSIIAIAFPSCSISGTASRNIIKKLCLFRKKRGIKKSLSLDSGASVLRHSFQAVIMCYHEGAGFI
jgi:hypothetical protein